MATAVQATPTLIDHGTPRFLWLDLTRKCQLECTHCYNASGPEGTHGTMTREDWLRLLDQAADCGVRDIQLIGGEPTMHPHAAELVHRALSHGMTVEVFSNLVHVTDAWWALLQLDGVRLATSYYSDHPDQHNAMTGRPSYARTRANIAKAVQLGVPLRVGIIVGGDEQRAEEARQELESLGVSPDRIGFDQVRPFGRGADSGQAPDPANLCGRCGTGQAAISPDGKVSPCVFSTWLDVGNVRDAPLGATLTGTAMAEAIATIHDAVGERWGCNPKKTPCHPDRAPCGPDQNPRNPCSPDESTECGPGTPPSTCPPRR